MKKILSKTKLLVVFILLAVSCQKDAIQLNEESNKVASATKQQSAGACRVTQYYYFDAIHSSEQIENYTYKNGLVDEWYAYYGVVFKMEYEKNGNMKIARSYFDGELINTIHFVYKNNKVVKEIWYAGNTQVIEDEVNNTYNEKGQLIKNQSVAFDYYVVNTYTAQGYLESWFFYLGGIPASKGVYTYNDNIKDPLELARPGIEYSFAWINSAFGTGNRWYSSEKIILYDETGEPFVHYDLDANKTKWQTTEQNYPSLVTYTDVLSSGTIINSFNYENCGSTQNLNSTPKQKPVLANRKKITNPIDRLFHGPSSEIFEQLKQRRLHKTTN